MPNYIYTTNIPFEDNDPSTDQPNMKTNTNSINSILDVDMIGFNDADGGYHSKVTYVNQGSDPGSAAAQFVVYSKAVSGSSQLFYQKDGVATAYQLTGSNPIDGTNGESFLPGGFGIKWGQVTTSSGTHVVTYTGIGLTAFSSATRSVQLTPINAGGKGNFRVSTANATSFTIVSPSGSSFYFMVTGV